MKRLADEHNHRLLYWKELSFIIISLAIAFHSYRLLLLPQSGSLDVNDRSRWLTVRALVDNHTYAIGLREKAGGEKGYKDSGIMMEQNWGTIDKVLDPKTQVFYSSKPPLFPTIVAGEYWVLRKIFGLSFEENARSIVVLILFTTNIIPFLFYLLAVRSMTDRFAEFEWTKVFVLLTAGFGTFISPFLTTLNNHTMAAFALCGGLYFFFKIWIDKKETSIRYMSCGLFLGWMVCNELPSLIVLLTVFLAIFLRSLRGNRWFFALGAAIPITLLLVTNYLSVSMFMPVYEKFGSEWYNFPGSYWTHPVGIDALKSGLLSYTFHMLIGHHGFFSLSPVFLLVLWGMQRSYVKKNFIRGHLKELMMMTAIVSAAIFIFYVLRSNNFGGISIALRWTIWLIPLWLLCLIPSVDTLTRHLRGKVLSLSLLYVSIFSASSRFINPWVHPWLYDWMKSLHWL